MRIKKLFLFANNLLEQKSFYERLGFESFFENDALVIIAGESELHFTESADFWPYHFCFLIPSEQLNSCLDWLKTKLKPIVTDDSGPIFPLDSWNAESLYFHDADGNLAEFIVRHDLKHPIIEPFSAISVVNLNEIGLPTADINKTNAYLDVQMNSKFWKGNTTRFGTNGDQNGLFLLVNTEVKHNWFPTGQTVYNSPFTAIVESDGRTFEVQYSESDLLVEQLD